MDTQLDLPSSTVPPSIRELEFLERAPGRHKTALRLRYESEARVILRQIGGLEGARKTLGLSQRKICQLLLVDPSAWTRWTRDEAKVPPHVVRSLQWYLTLETKDPAWSQWRELILKREPDPNMDRWCRDLEQKLKKTVPSHKPVEIDPEIPLKLQRLQDENRRLAGDLERQMVIGVGWKLVLLINSIALIILVLRQLF
ncbi:MAG: hypothetical protein AB7N80_15115 [Bdellovibrionales bacterium]